jgi:hypothetical protein
MNCFKIKRLIGQNQHSFKIILASQEKKYFMKSIYTLAVILFLPFIILGQSISPDVPNILPPSPTASDLGKYTLLGSGLNTGGASVNLPVYDYATPNLSLPVSLMYSSDGIKVDQTASRVGLGWTLNAGGAVSRTVLWEP